MGELNFLELKTRSQGDLDKLYILCKEGLKKNAIDDFANHKMVVNKYFVSAILQSEAVSDLVRKELKKIDSTIKAEEEEVAAIIQNDIIKRELIDSLEAKDAAGKYDKLIKKALKDKGKAAVAKTPSAV